MALSISTPKPLPIEASQHEKQKTQEKFRRRASIEPIIDYLKHDHRMTRNFLKRQLDDFINCVLAAEGFNLKKMLRKIASSLNCQINLVVCFYFEFLRRKQKAAF